MRNVLMVAYMFPPIGGIGAQRTVQFAKYLPEFGWRPVILTVAGGQEFVHDAGQTDTLPSGATIYRARSWEPLNAARARQAVERIDAGGSAPARSTLRSRMVDLLRFIYFTLRVPDDKIGWLPFAVRRGQRVLRTEPIDLIYATAPPYTNLLIGRRLKELSGKPLIVDYRDEWSTIEYRSAPTNRFIRQVNRQLERLVLRRADLVLSALPTLPNKLQRRELMSAATPSAIIMNGFDPADYLGVDVGDLRTPNKFVITYTGSFFGDRRTPDEFLRGLHLFLTHNPAAAAHIEVRLVGGIYARHTHLIDALGLQNIVRLLGVVPHREAARHQLAADLLLLVVGSGPGSDVMLTGKLFEYLGAGRPILALAPEHSPAAHLVQEAGAGRVVAPEDLSAVAAALGEFYAAWTAGESICAPDAAVIARFDRRRLTEQLAATFDHCLDQADQLAD